MPNSLNLIVIDLQYHTLLFRKIQTQLQHAISSLNVNVISFFFNFFVLSFLNSCSNSYEMNINYFKINHLNMNKFSIETKLKNLKKMEANRKILK